MPAAPFLRTLPARARVRARFAARLARLARLFGVLALATLGASACAPGGAGAGPPPKPAQFLKADPVARSVQLTLIAGYPGTPTEFNFDGYTGGALSVTVPAGWRVTVKCENQGSVAHSCAVTKGSSPEPVQPTWSTTIPLDGLQPGTSESFSFTPEAPGGYRIACLVPGHEDSGMWVRFEVASGGEPSISGQAS